MSRRDSSRDARRLKIKRDRIICSVPFFMSLSAFVVVTYLAYFDVEVLLRIWYNAGSSVFYGLGIKVKNSYLIRLRLTSGGNGH